MQAHGTETPSERLKLGVGDALREGLSVRRELPDGGRLYVDRPLPMLLVHRHRRGCPEPGTESLVTASACYLVANTEVQVNFHNERPIGVQLPPTVTLAVTQTEPNLKGATATGSFKPAQTETGVTVMVPQFVIEGTRIKVNTDTGEYVERA